MSVAAARPDTGKQRSVLQESSSATTVAAVAERIAEIAAKLEELGVDSLESTARAALTTLSFSEALLSTKVRDLSGGWRTRLEFARALFAAPDILLLDEPTNHLDLHATLRLAGILRQEVQRGMTVVLVSHDAAFIDLIATDMISLHRSVSHHAPQCGPQPSRTRASNIDIAKRSTGVKSHIRVLYRLYRSGCNLSA